ncbi:hypothetical protein ABK040_003299 [Willaertia magna]
MSPVSSFVDETDTVVNNQIEKKRLIKKNQKKGRLRKLLKNNKLLENYFEWNRMSPAIQFEVTNRQHVIYSHIPPTCVEIEANKENNQQTNSLDNPIATSSKDSPNFSYDMESVAHNKILEVNQIPKKVVENRDMNSNCKGSNRIIESEFFKLKLDIDDFILSYLEMNKQ